MYLILVVYHYLQMGSLLHHMLHLLYMQYHFLHFQIHLLQMHYLYLLHYIHLLFHMDVLHQLKKNGKTIVLVLHDLQQALNVSDGIIVMDGGKVVSAASPEETLSAGVLERVFHVQIGMTDNPAGKLVLNMEKLR